MTNEQFRIAVKQMREAQKRYFRTRDPVVLNESKRLEQAVDKSLAEYDQGQKSFLERELDE